jgi:hypothetical protein
MLLAQSSIQPTIVCDPADMSFIKFREIQSNDQNVQRTHTRTYTARWCQEPTYVKMLKTHFTKPYMYLLVRNQKGETLKRPGCDEANVDGKLINCQNYV